MKNVIKYFESIESGFKKMKFITVSVLCFCLIFVLGITYFAFASVNAVQERIYIVDHGQAFSASLASGNQNRDLEIHDHVARFHELMFRLSPSKEAITRNIDRALIMCDKSAYDYYMDLSEKDFYSRLVNANISQDFSIDSIKIHMHSYPYGARLFGKLYVLRENSITAYDFESSCELVDIERSTANPHGLMMEHFKIEKNEKLETRRRK